MSRRLGALVLVLSSLAACATPAPSGRIIPLVPGYPLSAESISAEPGEQLTWVNGDPARGQIKIEFDRVSSMPAVSSKSGVYTARFGAAGTYPYTVTGLGRTGIELVPRRGEVVVRERPAAAAPGAGRPEGAAPGRPPGAPTPRPALDAAPVGADIARLEDQRRGRPRVPLPAGARDRPQGRAGSGRAGVSPSRIPGRPRRHLLGHRAAGGARRCRSRKPGPSGSATRICGASRRR